jgi:hypothetical protein
MGCDAPRYWTARQVQATFSLWSGKAAMEFLSEWLRWCRDRRCITDDQNECGLPNLPGYVEHRHDQSILTNLCIRRGVAAPSTPYLAPGMTSKNLNILSDALARGNEKPTSSRLSPTENKRRRTRPSLYSGLSPPFARSSTHHRQTAGSGFNTTN